MVPVGGAPASAEEYRGSERRSGALHGPNSLGFYDATSAPLPVKREAPSNRAFPITKWIAGFANEAADP